MLNAHLFESLAELHTLTDAWLRICNGERPRDSLGRVPPLTFLQRPSAAGQSPFDCPLDWEAYATPKISRKIAKIPLRVDRDWKEVFVHEPTKH